MNHTNHDRWIKPAAFASDWLGAERQVEIYLPSTYAGGKKQSYPVLYLHDGQNMFSFAGEHACYGWGNWSLDRIVDSLVQEGRIREIILVAIHNSSHRYAEYQGPSPAPARRSVPEGKRCAVAGKVGGNRFEAYAGFLREELKPWIDRHYRTLRGPEFTGVLGSSLGGLCSLALAWEYPKVFGLAASLSGSFQVQQGRFARRMVGEHQGPPKPVRLYLDSGIVDDDDDDGRSDTEAVVLGLRRLGWRDGENLQHHVETTILGVEALRDQGLPEGKFTEARRSQHNEFYWRRRAWRPLVFLFSPVITARSVKVKRSARKKEGTSRARRR